MTFGHLLRHVHYFAFLIFAAINSFGQTVFDDNGKLTELKVSANGLMDVAQDILKDKSDEIKKDARELCGNFTG